jgi:hypothetical protein
MIALKILSLQLILLFSISCNYTPLDSGLQTISAYSDFNANRLFIKYGLQLHCWTSTEEYFTVDQGDWDLIGFGGPTFFRPPMWSPDFMEANPLSQWSMAKAPYASNIDREPDEQERQNGFLDSTQLSRLKDLTTICFGDEEPFNYELVSYLRSWYKVSHSMYPNVMVHNNQWGSQWTEEDLRLYVLIAKPDLVTFDAYLFNSSNSDNYRGASQMAEYLMKYRTIAMMGLDGVGEEPIGFGQYIQGFRLNQSYDMTESQLRLYYYMTWAFGGKWLNWFRYLQGHDDGDGGTELTDWSMLLENGVPGNPAPAAYWAGQCNLESKNLSDYLVRLQTTDVRLVLGDFGVSGGIPRNVDYWAQNADPYIVGINARVTGSEDTGKRGDVYVGYFKIIPAQEQGDPGFFENPDALFFMLVNAYTSRNIQSADEAAQEITVYLDIGDKSADCIQRIDRESGAVEMIPLRSHGGSQYSFTITLPGGTGDLFYIDQ